MNLPKPYSGSCQCGECTYAVTAPPYVAYTCHCKECQRLSASASNTCIQVPAESIELASGTPAEQSRKLIPEMC